MSLTGTQTGTKIHSQFCKMSSDSNLHVMYVFSDIYTINDNNNLYMILSICFVKYRVYVIISKYFQYKCGKFLFLANKKCRGF